MQKGFAFQLPHCSNHCATLYLVTFLDETFLVVAIGTQELPVVLDDNQLAVSHQTITTVNNLAVPGGRNLCPCLSSNFYTTACRIGRSKCLCDLALDRPLPVQSIDFSGLLFFCSLRRRLYLFATGDLRSCFLFLLLTIPRILRIRGVNFRGLPGGVEFQRLSG